MPQAAGQGSIHCRVRRMLIGAGAGCSLVPNGDEPRMCADFHGGLCWWSALWCRTMGVRPGDKVPPMPQLLMGESLISRGMGCSVYPVHGLPSCSQEGVATVLGAQALGGK